MGGSDWGWVKPLVDAFGPAAAAFASVAAIIFLIWRRDNRTIQAQLREDRTELLQAIRDVTRAVDQQRQSGETFKEGLQTIVRAFEQEQREQRQYRRDDRRDR